MPDTSLTNLFTSIANAIRTKKSTESTIKASDFPQEILSIGYTYPAGRCTDTISVIDISNSITLHSLTDNCEINIYQICVANRSAYEVSPVLSDNGQYFYIDMSGSYQLSTVSQEIDSGHLEVLPIQLSNYSTVTNVVLNG